MSFNPLFEKAESEGELGYFRITDQGTVFLDAVDCPNKTMTMLLQYQWPGNLRELRNTIQSLIMSSDGDKILPENLTPSICSSKSK